MILRVMIWTWLFAAGIAGAADDAAARRIPRPAHVIVVFEENRAFSHIIGNMAAPYINTLANRGALFTQSRSEEHTSVLQSH